MTTRELEPSPLPSKDEPGPAPAAAATTAPSATSSAPLASPPRPARDRSINRISVIVLVVGLALTAALTWTTFHLNRNNEARLLRLETKQAGTVLSAVVPTIQTPLDSAVGIATRNPDSAAARFRAYIASYVGVKDPFESASLWQLSSGTARLVLAVGSRPTLAADPAGASRFLSSVKPGAPFSIAGPLGSTARPRLGYAVAGPGGANHLVVYAESPLPAGRRAVVTPGSAFSDLDFALYLGRTQTSAMLLEANVRHLPIRGRTTSEVIPFGNSALLLVGAPARSLAGPVAADLWWILAAGGALMSLAAAATAEGLVRRRLAAEGLTGEVEHLLGEQRSIAETLQHALLPAALPAVAGIESAVRYLPGTNGVEIGGDWYDLMPLDGGRFFFVVGDVSGRGVPAGSVMAALRFALRAFASEGHSPVVALESLRGMLDVADDHHFATVVCGIGDVGRHEVTIASAGHLPPLCVAATGAHYLETPVGVPIGVTGSRPYRSATVPVPPGATLIIYTDGLIERRGENIDEGLERLRAAASAVDAVPLDSMLQTVVSDLAQDGLDDDTAILGVRWLS